MRTRPAARPTLLAGAALLGALATMSGLAGQAIEGRALDPEGRPLPDATVALHRVGGGGGAFVDAAATDADGRFTFRIAAEDSAVHFVALRYEDRLYIGPPVRGPSAPDSAYVVRADPAAEAGALASALSGEARGRAAAADEGGRAGSPAVRGAAGRGASDGAASDGAGAFWLVGLLGLGTAATFLLAAPRYRTRRRRELLVELAVVENALASGAGDGGGASLEERRAALRGRLEPPG